MRVYPAATAFCIVLCLLTFATNISTTAIAQEPDPTIGRVSYIELGSPPGKLKVKQKKGEQPADATVGMPVRRGYLLTLTPPAKAAVSCADGTKHDLRPGVQGCPCAVDAQGYIYNGSNIPRTRGYDSLRGDFPAIISPRKGFLLATRPIIRWTALKTNESATYEVSMYTELMDLVWRKKEITGTMLAYPAGEPALLHGEVYKVVVQSGRKSSNQEKTEDPFFTVLRKGDSNSIHAAEEKLRQQNLPEANTQFLIAELYAARGLYSEAIEILTATTMTIQAPSVLRLLGELYAILGLHREAVKQYEIAVNLPQIESDIEGQALTFSALGRSYTELGEHQQAAASFAHSVKAYQKLGDKVTVEQLRDGDAK
ncbi:MAG TPA: tetratricopeptide repeat protein [Pyrinomonadaceae bacterium]|nr:tetratricopeptide repeat protein [Pyrinomonadaceae bacterium]